MKVLVLGCGPAGLMATHAAALHGDDVIIVSKARKSHMRGAQYLHRPIPLASGGAYPFHDSFRVNYVLRGSADAYRAKVYGPEYRGTVSPEDLTEDHEAWDIRAAYDWLWETYSTSISHADLSRPDLLREVLKWASPDICISTIPATLLCQYPEEHAFRSEEIWSNDSDFGTTDNTVICNGEKEPAWYRSAKIQGHTTVEWPNQSRPPMEVHNVVKPLATTCSCHADIVRMGRYGRWEKGVLSHTAFYETAQYLSSPHQEALKW